MVTSCHYDWPKERQLSKLSITYEKEEWWLVMPLSSSYDVIQESLLLHCRISQQLGNLGYGTSTI